MRLREFFGIAEAPEQRQHSIHCVCKGKNWIWDTRHGTTGLNGSTPISGNVKIPCPYGDLRVNQPTQVAPSNDDDDWDL